MFKFPKLIRINEAVLMNSIKGQIKAGWMNFRYAFLKAIETEIISTGSKDSYNLFNRPYKVFCLTCLVKHQGHSCASRMT